MVLTWTRWRRGFYTCGNFRIERVDALYGPTWSLTIDGQPTFSETKKTLHECKSIAGSVAREASLFVGARLT